MADVRSLFNVGTRPAGTRALAPGGGGAPNGQNDVRQGAFVTVQTLTSFAGASGVVALLWKVAALVRPAWNHNTNVALVCAIVVGAMLFVISESDPARGPLTPRDWLI